MNVHVRLLGMFRLLAGRPEDTIELPEGSSVRQLLEAIAGRYGRTFADQLHDEFGGISPGCQLVVGDEPVSRRDLDRPLTTDRVTVFFISGMAGGAG